MNAGDEREADELDTLRREIEACDVRLNFLTQNGYDDRRVGMFRQELHERRDRAEQQLAALISSI
ncbi:MAG TPA: hypothetical protein VEH79_05725 [Gaiellaceae bacterium]|nr:hypothetical protein [Gaiellaceae bacterium]